MTSVGTIVNVLWVVAIAFLFLISKMNQCLTFWATATRCPFFHLICFFLVGDMLDLLKWRAHPDKIAGCLAKLKDIDGSEIVKVWIVLILPLVL